jgi:hypothetical protein
MIIHGLIGDGGRDSSYTFTEGLEERLRVLRAERQEQDILLLVETRSGASLDLAANHREHDGTVVGFDLYDKTINDEHHDRTIDYAVNAVSIIADQNVDLVRLVRGGYVLGDDGKRYFSYTVVAHAPKLIVARPFTDVARATDLLSRLEQRKDLEPVANLLADSASQQDAFRGWLAAWTGLEMFVVKRFGFYEKIVHQQVVAAASSVAIRAYIERVRGIASGKHSLVDKFRVIAICLYPSGADDDIDTFKTLKGTRDRVLHQGKELPSDLGHQTDRIRTLLRQYLSADLTWS